MQLHAPAKINLSFRIRGRRADGYHEIETLMTTISLVDVITITPEGTTGEINFVCDDPSLPAGDDNLVMKAARLFFQATKVEGGVRIQLEKKIPHGAGLGGGSSDAAATLLGLNSVFGTDLPQETLRDLAAGIGSDVPFFIFEGAALCRGRGELVEPAPSTHALPLLLLKPAFGVPTPWAYSKWLSSKELPGIDYAAQELSDLSFVNDLERPVFEKFLFLAQLKTWLRAQREVAAALMSGSGSTVFAVLRDPAQAEKLATRARVALDAELWSCGCTTSEN